MEERHTTGSEDEQVLPIENTGTPEWGKKQKEYLDLLGLETPPDAFIALDAGVATRKKGQKWTPTSYEDETANWREQPGHAARPSYEPRRSDRNDIVIGAMGGKARALATVELYRYLPCAIVTTSKNSEEQAGDVNPQDPWAVYRDYLIRRGIPEQMIVSEKESTSTFEQIVGLIELAQEHQWKTMVIIINDHHLPRTKTFFEYLTNKDLAWKKLRFLLAQLTGEAQKRIGIEAHGTPQNPEIVFKNTAFFDAARMIRIIFTSAEEILIRRDPSYARIIDQAKQLPFYQKRLAAEHRGLAQLTSGAYGKPR